MKADNQKYCIECAELINSKAEICPKCGVRQPMYQPIISDDTINQRNKWITCILLCWFFGVFGVHRFYAGHILTGIIQLLTLGGCGIWALIDFIIIVTGNFKDSNGLLIKNA
jgi:TM2 domain-containing membrane protein YozV